MPKSKKDLSQKLLPQLADALAKDEEFCSIVVHSFFDCAEWLNAVINKIAATVKYPLPSSLKSVSQSFATHLIQLPLTNLSATAVRLQGIFMEYNQSKNCCKHFHRNIAKCLEFTANKIDHRTNLLASISIIELNPLPMPYPSKGHIVLERHYPTPPPSPKLCDLICSYLYKYCELDET